LSLSKNTLTVLIGTITFLSITIYYKVIGFDIVISDVELYRLWSYELLSHMEPQQLPGLPVLLALLRLITLKIISDYILMQLIVYIAWLVSIKYVLKILDELAADSRELGALFIGLFPLFGVSMIAYPAADIIAHAMFFATIFYSIRFEKMKFMLFFIIASFTHKVIWPFLLLLALLNFIGKKINFSQLVFIFIPIISYYLLIYFSSDQVNLGILSNFSTNLNLTSNLTYPLAGIIDNFYQGDLISFLKGILLILVFLLSMLLIMYGIKTRDRLLLIMTAPIVILAIFVNEFTAISLLRHSKILIIPFCIWLSYEQSYFLSFLNKRSSYILLLAVLIATQYLFGWYQVYYDYNYSV
jgi:hypothetical protein